MPGSVALLAPREYQTQALFRHAKYVVLAIHTHLSGLRQQVRKSGCVADNRFQFSKAFIRRKLTFFGLRIAKRNAMFDARRWAAVFIWLFIVVYMLFIRGCSFIYFTVSF